MAESTNGTVNTLKIRMDQMDVSPRRLAEKIGVTRQRVYQILSGDHPVTDRMAEKICDVLHCKRSDVFELQENPKKIIVPRRVTRDELPETLQKFKSRKRVRKAAAGSEHNQ